LACTAAASAQTAAYGHPDETHRDETATACPWLTAGTAADILGGDVLLRIAGNATDEGACHFARRGSATEFLEIHVSAEPLHGCPAGSAPLHGVGNQTERCRIADARGIAEERASGRVRALYFTVTIAGRAPRESGKPSESDDRLARLADEVAGNLY
jgi:hypothetical protein